MAFLLNNFSYYIVTRKMKLDATDKKILGELQKDGRESASHIAEKIDVSVPTVTERIRKLQDAGIIKRFQAVVNPKAVGLDVAAIITICPIHPNIIRK